MFNSQLRSVRLLLLLCISCLILLNFTAHMAMALSPATTNPNPAGASVSSMSANDMQSRILENYGTILGGDNYTDSEGFYPIVRRAGMYGYSPITPASITDYSFANGGIIDMSKNIGDVAYAMYAYAGHGSHNLNNYGDISVSGNSQIYGIHAFTTQDGSHSLSSDGFITLNGHDTLHALYAYAAKGSHTLSNSGSIEIIGTGGAQLRGLHAEALYGSHELINTGIIDIKGHSQIYGLSALSTYTGSHKLTSTANITISGSDTLYGLYAETQEGSHILYSNADISITATGTGETTFHGMHAFAQNGSHTLTSEGIITVKGNSQAYGMSAFTTNTGNHELLSTANISVSGSDTLHGMYAYAGTGSHTLFNSCDINITGTGGAQLRGMHAFAQNGSHTLTSEGIITVKGNSQAYGMSAFTTNTGNHKLLSTAHISVSGSDTLHGMYAYAGNGSHALTNFSSIEVNGTTSLYGMHAEALFGSHELVNIGNIDIIGNNQLYGMYAFSTYDGAQALHNHGTINVSGNYFAYGMYLGGTALGDTAHMVNNTGIISVSASRGTAYEVFGTNNYSVGTFATTLRPWTAVDTVFGGSSGAMVDFAQSNLILRPRMTSHGIELNKDYYIRDMVSIDGDMGNPQYINGKINASTDIPFLRAVLSNDDPKSASVRLEENVNEDTISGNTSVEQISHITHMQMSNVAKAFKHLIYNDIYSKQSSFSAGSNHKQKRWQMFFHPYVNFVNNTDYTGSNTGITAGVTYNVNESFSLGLHLDFSLTQLEASIMDMQSDGNSLAFGLHATYKIMPEWYISAQITGAVSSMENEYGLYDGAMLFAENTVHSQALYASLSSGYIWEFTKKHSLAPEIGLSYLSIHTNAYDINWRGNIDVPDIYHMSYDDSYYTALYAHAHLTWRSVWECDEDSSLALFAGLGMRINISNNEHVTHFSSLGSKYRVYSNEDVTSALATVGISYQKEDFSVSVNYEGSYGATQNTHGANVVVKFEF